MKILIIRFGAIGDLVMTTLLLRCLRQRFPEGELHLLTGREHRSVLSANPYLTAIHEVSEHSINLLKDIGFDQLLDLEHNEQSASIAKAIGGAVSKVRKYSFREALFTRLKWNLLPKEHLAERFLQTAAHLGVVNDGKGLDYFIPESEAVPHNDIPTSHQLGYVAIVIGGSKWNKRLPAEKLMELCREIEHPIILMGGRGEFQTGEVIKAVDNVKIYNACGKFSLHESADLVRMARLVVSNDTGLMHIAAAFKRPVITIWGSTTPSLNMYPYYGATGISAQHVQVEQLWCRPCSTHGLDRCPQVHFKCMKKINVNDIAVKVEAVLRRK